MTPLVSLRTFAAIAALLAATTAAHAVVIYRWVDDRGQVHMSDVVPEKYKRSAKQIDAEKFGVSPDDQSEAAARAAKEKALADELTRRREQGDAAQRADAASAPVRQAGAPKGTTKSDCEAWWRLYRENQACFAPYQNSNGTQKPGAHDNCVQVESPEKACGVDSWYNVK